MYYLKKFVFTKNKNNQTILPAFYIPTESDQSEVNNL